MVKHIRLTFEQFKEVVEARGYKLLIKKEEYTGVSGVYAALCPAGHNCNIRYQDFKKGGTCCRPCGRENGKITNKAKYGTENPMQNKQVQQKRKDTCMDRFGTEHALQNPALMEKKNATMMERHGVEYAMQNPELKEKQRATMGENHGVEFTLQSTELFNKQKATMMERHGVEHATQKEEFLLKQEATMMERYGVKRPSQKEEFMEKQKATMLKRFGAEHFTHVPELLAKARATMLERHGVEFPAQSQEIYDKIVATRVERYGVENLMDIPGAEEKRKATMLERYGAEYPAQVPEIFAKQQKALFAYKEYELPSGKVILYQGYENFCLDDLLEEGYQEEEIVNSVEEVPVISYSMEETDHKYFPDIFIPKENKLIEIKCKFTLKRNFEKNMAKAKACIEQGYIFELRIYDDKGSYTILDI